jgi:hypothetical protein
MKRYKVVIISQNTIVFSDTLKAHDSGHAIGRLSAILAQYEHCKVQCDIIEDDK